MTFLLVSFTMKLQTLAKLNGVNLQKPAPTLAPGVIGQEQAAPGLHFSMNRCIHTLWMVPQKYDLPTRWSSRGIHNSTGKGNRTPQSTRPRQR